VVRAGLVAFLMSAAAGCSRSPPPTPVPTPWPSITSTPFLPAGFAGLPTGDVLEATSTQHPEVSASGVDQSSGEAVPPTDGRPLLDLAAVNEAINRIREREGVPPLKVSPGLTGLAQARAEELSETRSLWHVEADSERTPGQQMIQAGFSGGLAEHAVAVMIQAEDPVGIVLQAMLTDLAHRHNLLDPQFSLTGLGLSDDGRWWYLVQLLAERGPSE